MVVDEASFAPAVLWNELARYLSAGVRFLVLECGSALANFPLLPRGATLLLLCMRDHSTSKGCYMQLYRGDQEYCDVCVGKTDAPTGCGCPETCTCHRHRA